MQPETEADGARRKRAEAVAETETEHEELRTFSNTSINTLAFVLKLWPGTCVAQTGLPPPLTPPSIPNIIKHMRAGGEKALRTRAGRKAGERTLINNWHCCAV